MISLRYKKYYVSVFVGMLLYVLHGTVYANDSDPNMSSGYSNSTEASYNSKSNSSINLHDSTNPVVNTGEGYYIPGDRNFDRNTTYQSRTYEGAESRRSTTYDDRNQ